ncbi:MAG: DUF1192 family protein [Sphingomonadaceae bacterium]
MDLDDIIPDKPEDPLTRLTRQDLDPFSLEELDARIAILQAEIERVRKHKEDSVNHLARADELFRKKG